MDIYAAQKMFGRGRKFDRIDVGVTPGRTIAQTEEELRALVGPGFQVEPPSGRGQQFETMLAAYSMMVNISSLFALFIGMFIIYNSFAIAVSERRSEIGILRRRRDAAQIRWLFNESAVTGLIDRSAAGVRRAHRARDRGVDRRADQRRMASRSTPTSHASPWCSRWLW
jgi:putative ABC transport system permease protein